MHAFSSIRAQLPDKDVAIRAACTARQTQKKLKAFIWNALMAWTPVWMGTPAATRSPALSTVVNKLERSATT